MVPKANLQDVARAVGVHRSTVSLALRGHPRIPEATRRRVTAAAKELSYRINPLVSSLMQSRRSPRARLSLAFVSSDSSSRGDRTEPGDQLDYFAGANKAAHEYGFQLERFWWKDADVGGHQFSDSLSLRGIRGVIVDGLHFGATAPALEWDRFSCIALGSAPQLPAFHRVVENDFDALGRTLRRCRERGYHRVGLVLTSPFRSSQLADRSLGAFALDQLGCSPGARLPVCPGRPAAAKSFTEWFCAHRPDALLVDDPPTVLAWLTKLGRHVPQDVGLAGFQLHPAAPCAGYVRDPGQTGRLAVEMLLGLMHRRETGIPAVPHEILLSAAWNEHPTLPSRRVASESES